jgi:hypothetical protein
MVAARSGLTEQFVDGGRNPRRDVIETLLAVIGLDAGCGNERYSAARCTFCPE